MGYSSQNDKRPFEAASKASHHHIINDPEVKKLLTQLYSPKAEVTERFEERVVKYLPPEVNPIEAIVAVDGGYSEAVLQKQYPSKLLHFMQFGALLFKTQDLKELEKSNFIAPEDMAKLKNLQRLKLVLPTKNYRLKTCDTLTVSVLEIIYSFFLQNSLEEKNSLLDTVAWFLFRRYKGKERLESEKSWLLATNPNSSTGASVLLNEEKMGSDFTFLCPETGKKIRLTDVFRLHEAIDEERGAVGILGYLLNVVEHFIIIHLIRHLLDSQPGALHKVMFIKDGPTGFFGQTARLHEPMRDLVEWLHTKHEFFLVGLEKSGAFVDHAQELEGRLKPGSVLILDDDYIYQNILPGVPDPNRPYAATSNYGHKVIFKTLKGQMHVVSVPTAGLRKKPCADDLRNLPILLANVETLHCDMYDSALFPVALVNRLVSLAAHPSQRILQRFAIATVS